jgi:hypothetical protein
MKELNENYRQVAQTAFAESCRGCTPSSPLFPECGWRFFFHDEVSLPLSLIHTQNTSSNLHVLRSYW